MNNYTLWGLFGPSTWTAWLLVLGTLAITLAPRRAAGKWLLRLAVVTFLLLSILPVGLWLIRPLETRFPAAPLRQAPTDIVVLAGAERLRTSADVGRLEVSEAGDRVIEGLALARRYPSAKLWIVGGVRAPGFPETDSHWVTDAWQRMGLPADRIVTVEGTLDTCQNAAGVADRLTSKSPPLLVTSAFHMPRAVACFRRVGIDPLPYPVDFHGWQPRSFTDAFSSALSNNLERADMALHEWIGLLWYRLSGRTAEILPAPRAKDAP